MRIVIDIDIVNHAEILEKHKGGFASLLANSSFVKEQVELEIRKEILNKLTKALKDGLSENGVKARIRIN
ncbi:hypothetical protein [Clostridium folliculivorans]|uniref:Uncharacterized protein n=1 Tax=Clostridium folliculivorans TaxID=2886038 RepID=A0A9W6DB32_9CLOT|nr:hypothetical protein [Clostridium folliculivorans]GKU25591.1 hypothetical protein CFOLD11_24170 [Clostridium folliculivorans]GKU28613.1 hypothetical protein CFB3_07190 [Clostridium folliculivorans]